MLVLALPFAAGAQKHVRFFVALTGSDKAAGSMSKPFATLQRARLAVREYVRNHPIDSITVLFRQGVYSFKESLRLDSLDSGHDGAPIVYSAYRGEAVSFSGGISVPTTKAVKIKDKAILDRMVPEARKYVLQVDLKALGISDLGTMQPKGFGRLYTPSAMELFCNKQAMLLSRWPNDSMVPIGKVLDAGSIPRNGDYSKRGGIFTYDVQRPQRWAQANEIWISGFFRYGYADDAVRIARIDTVNKTFTTQQETQYGFEGGKTFQRWYAFNLLEEIDQPGEYCVDRNAGILYFYPPAGKLNSIELSLLETPLLVLKNTMHVVFKNIIFECSRGMGVYMERGSGNRIEDCTIRNLGQLGVCIGKGTKPAGEIWQKAGLEPASEVVGGLYATLYDNTVFNRDAGTGHTISGCHIYNTGSGGISLGGGNRLTLESGNNQVVNCSIHDFNRIERSYKAGINIDGVGNSIRNNEIFNCPGSAILLHGNNHLIERNMIHHAVTDGHDMGAVYYGRDPSEQGNKIINNYFHHIGNDDGMIMAIYHDDGACGMEVTGNIFYKAGSRTIMIGGGNDNHYRNNIFIDCPLALHLDARLIGWAKSFVQKNGLFEQRLEAVHFKQPPYSSSYPELVNYFNDSLGLPKRNFIENNVFVNVGTLHNGKATWARLGNNWITAVDPGFVDWAAGNFGLKPNAAVYKQLPEFKSIPFESIGIQKDRNGSMGKQSRIKKSVAAMDPIKGDVTFNN